MVRYRGPGIAEYVSLLMMDGPRGVSISNPDKLSFRWGWGVVGRWLGLEAFLAGSARPSPWNLWHIRQRRGNA